MLVYLLLTITVSFCVASIVQGFGARHSEGVAHFSKCPCDNPDWCKPVGNPTKAEVFAFSVRNKEDRWHKFDWTKVTTVAQAGYVNASLACLAHSHNARAVVISSIDMDTMMDTAVRKRWIQKQVKLVQDNFLDGINFDYEEPITKDQLEYREAYTQTVAETSKALKAINPLYQISVDVAWKPNVDVRYYDYKGLGEIADIVFVMAYDEQSQIFGECVAMPNAGIHMTEAGLDEYLNNPEFLVSPHKLVLGVPWYGYGYACMTLKGDKCIIHEVPFRGVPCSDAAGKEYDFVFIRTLLNTVPNKAKWNETSQTPFISYEEAPGIAYQMQFDNPKSLSLKYDLAKKKGIRGVGMWNIDNIDYSDLPEGQEMRKEMFGGLP